MGHIFDEGEEGSGCPHEEEDEDGASIVSSPSSSPLPPCRHCRPALPSLQFALPEDYNKVMLSLFIIGLIVVTILYERFSDFLEESVFNQASARRSTNASLSPLVASSALVPHNRAPAAGHRPRALPEDDEGAGDSGVRVLHRDRHVRPT